MPSYDRALHALRSWLDSWAGIGHVTVGMARQGYDLQLTRYDERGWRATFYTTGMEHSPTSATGTGWERTPWRATPAGGVGGVEEARGRERVGGARVEADEELHALLKRAATLMVKAGYRSYSVTIEVAGKEKRYGLMESSLFLDIVMKHRNPPQK
jgi:hypothetical protein